MRKAVLLSAVAVLGAAGVAALLLARRPAPMTGATFDALLASVDASISQGYLSTAADALRSVHPVPRGEGDRLRLLKRAFEIGRGSGEYSLLAALAGQALAGGAGSAKIRVVAAYAFLRTGRVTEGRRLLAGASGAAELEALRGEALLRSGAAWRGSNEVTREVLALDASSDPAAFARAGPRAGEERLSLDAALLAMQQGLPAQAAGVVRSQLAEARFDEPAGLILYDAGADEEAAVRLERRFSAGPPSGAIGFVLSDLYEEGAHPARARSWLLRSLSLAPSLSWAPYANLALFSLRSGDLSAAARRVEDGLAFFPGSRQLNLMKARVMAQSGDTGSAMSILERLLADRPSDTEAALLLLSLQGPALSPEALRARLWKLFELAPADPVVFDRLASTLTAARDWDGMRIAVEERQAAGGAPDSRSLLLQGFAAAMRGDDGEALAAFRQSDLMAKDGKARFDAALVLLRRGEARAARQELEPAAEEIRVTASELDRARLLSRVQTLRAAALMLDGDAEGASSALSEALQLDPNNLRAALLARKLEAGGR